MIHGKVASKAMPKVTVAVLLLALSPLSYADCEHPTEDVVKALNDYPGGKIAEIKQNGYRFDAGPSLLTMPQYIDELFTLAGKLRARNGDPALYARVLEEARWGLDWVLKTSFGDGFRDVGSINSRRTDCILGTDDDITVTARNNPMTNFESAAVSRRVQLVDMGHAA